jgi:aminopeptidase N
MRAALGERRFIRFLREFLDQHRYGIVTTADWEAAMAALGSPTVDQLYKEWVAAEPKAQAD